MLSNPARATLAPSTAGGTADARTFFCWGITESGRAGNWSMVLEGAGAAGADGADETTFKCTGAGF